MAVSKVALSGFGIIALAAASAALAHHSFAMFDNTRSMTLEGTIKEFQWTNPHGWVQLLVKDPSTEQTVEWPIECGSPNSMVHQGWTRKSMKEGDRATLVIHPLKDGTVGGSLVSAVINGVRVGNEASAAP